MDMVERALRASLGYFESRDRMNGHVHLEQALWSPITALIKAAVEKIEKEDAQDAAELEQGLAEDDGERVSLEELKRREQVAQREYESQLVPADDLRRARVAEKKLEALREQARKLVAPRHDLGNWNDVEELCRAVLSDEPSEGAL